MMTRHAGGVTRLANTVLLVCCLPACAFAQAGTIRLPEPKKDGGRPLMQVLQDRQSQREFRREPLPLPMLSNLLWAAFGINRPDGRRTAPSASNRQEIDIVADQSKMSVGAGDDRVLYAGANTGFISQNIYLYCASEGLATVVRGSIDRPQLARRMRLGPDQRIVLAQSVGYPSRK